MNDENDKKKILYFPELEKREALKKSKKEEATRLKKEQKERDAMEKEYRAKYRAEQAQKRATMGRVSANGKVPFFNWHNVPLFTRLALATFIIVHVIKDLTLNPAQRLYMDFHFGFVPGMYTGAVPWNWTGLASPFTSLIIHGGWMHLLINVVMMMAMGVFFERQFGAKRTFAFFLLCGLIGSLTCVVLTPFSTNPVVGASGGISGLFAVAVLTMIERGMAGPEAKRRGPMPFIILWSFILVGTGMIGSDTSWQSHIGGFLGGVGIFHLWRKGIIKF